MNYWSFKVRLCLILHEGFIISSWSFHSDRLPFHSVLHLYLQLLIQMKLLVDQLSGRSWLAAGSFRQVRTVLRSLNETKWVSTFVPIWFPHCPAWMWTISLIFLLSVLFSLQTFGFVAPRDAAVCLLLHGSARLHSSSAVLIRGHAATPPPVSSRSA